MGDEVSAAGVDIAARLAGTANFLRWAATFPKDEVSRHPSHDRVFLLSPMQSGRFSFALVGQTLYLGVQPFEAAWLACLPLAAAHISDRLYLRFDGVQAMGTRLSPIALGIFVDEQGKRSMMAQALSIQVAQVDVVEGRVRHVEALLGAAAPLNAVDIIEVLGPIARAQQKTSDAARFW